MPVSISGTARLARRSSSRWLATAVCFAPMGALPAHPSSPVPVASKRAVAVLDQAQRQTRPFIPLFVEESMQGHEDDGDKPAIGEGPDCTEQEPCWGQPLETGQ